MNLLKKGEWRCVADGTIYESAGTGLSVDDKLIAPTSWYESSVKICNAHNDAIEKIRKEFQQQLNKGKHGYC